MSWFNKVRNYIVGGQSGQAARPLAEMALWERFAGQANTEGVLQQKGEALGELLEHHIAQNSVPILLQSLLENDQVHVDPNRIWIAVLEMAAALMHIFDTRAMILLREEKAARAFNMALFVTLMERLRAFLQVEDKDDFMDAFLEIVKKRGAEYLPLRDWKRNGPDQSGTLSEAYGRHVAEALGITDPKVAAGAIQYVTALTEAVRCSVHVDELLAVPQP